MLVIMMRADRVVNGSALFPGEDYHSRKLQDHRAIMTKLMRIELGMILDVLGTPNVSWLHCTDSTQS